MDFFSLLWGYVGSAGLIIAGILAKYSKNEELRKRWLILVALGILLLFFKLIE